MSKASVVLAVVVSGLLGVVLGPAGCGFGDCVERRSELHFEPQGPGTAAVHVHGSTPSAREYVGARWLGSALNRGDAPCRIAIYAHPTEPMASAGVELDRDEAAPTSLADGGELRFESLLPSPRDGQVLVRQIDASRSDVLGDPFEHGDDPEPEDDPDLEHIDVWLTINTCADPQVEADLSIIGEICDGGRRTRGDVQADVWWPQ